MNKLKDGGIEKVLL
ncbi:MAG: hypothetical protein ACLS7H_09430 [Parasutterella sp.]